MTFLDGAVRALRQRTTWYGRIPNSFAIIAVV
jgi:hypothetical protein